MFWSGEFWVRAGLVENLTNNFLWPLFIAFYYQLYLINLKSTTINFVMVYFVCLSFSLPEPKAHI